MLCKICGGEVNLKIGRCTRCGRNVDDNIDPQRLHSLDSLAQKYGELDDKEWERIKDQIPSATQNKQSAADVRKQEKPRIGIDDYLYLMGEKEGPEEEEPEYSYSENKRRYKSDGGVKSAIGRLSENRRNKKLAREEERLARIAKNAKVESETTSRQSPINITIGEPVPTEEEAAPVIVAREPCPSPEQLNSPAETEDKEPSPNALLPQKRLVVSKNLGSVQGKTARLGKTNKTVPTQEPAPTKKLTAEKKAANEGKPLQKKERLFSQKKAKKPEEVSDKATVSAQTPEPGDTEAGAVLTAIRRLDKITLPYIERIRKWYHTKVPELKRAESSPLWERMAIVGALLAVVVLVIAAATIIAASFPDNIKGEWRISQENSRDILTLEFSSGGNVTAYINSDGEKHVYRRGTYETEKKNEHNLLVITFEDGKQTHLYYELDGDLGKFTNVDSNRSEVYIRLKD